MGLPNPACILFPGTLGIILKNKPSLSQGVRDGHIHTVIFKTDHQLRTYGTLFNVMWHPGWEESLGENGYIYTYG